MTLNTFHYASVSSKNVTLGLLQLKEIINRAFLLSELSRILLTYDSPILHQTLTIGACKEQVKN